MRTLDGPALTLGTTPVASPPRREAGPGRAFALCLLGLALFLERLASRLLVLGAALVLVGHGFLPRALRRRPHLDDFRVPLQPPGRFPLHVLPWRPGLDAGELPADMDVTAFALRLLLAAA